MSTLKASGFAKIPPEGGLKRNDSTPKFELGTVISDTLGNSYRYVQASEALFKGGLVTAVAKGAWDTAVLVDGTVNAASATKTIHVDAIATDADANAYAGYWLSQAAGETGNAPTEGIGHRIKGHPNFDVSDSTESDVFLEDNIAEAFANDVALLIYNPYLVENVDAVTEIIMGVGINAITADYYGFIQVGGHCPAVYCGGTTSVAITANEPIIPGATVTTDMIAGAGQGMSGSTETDIMETVCSPVLALQALAANTAGYVEAFIKGLV